MEPVEAVIAHLDSSTIAEPHEPVAGRSGGDCQPCGKLR
jgi:hypothetical protein